MALFNLICRLFSLDGVLNAGSMQAGRTMKRKTYSARLGLAQRYRIDAKIFARSCLASELSDFKSLRSQAIP